MADSTRGRIETLFTAAVELPPARRAAFLRAHCEDAACRDEVAALLAAHEEAEGFFGVLHDDLVTPVLRRLERDDGPDASGSPADPLGLTGAEVAGYAVQEHVSGGGMGVVYRAWDARLERSVALKFLPPVLAATPEARARFVEEARTAARIDHPNVATIHEIGQTEQGRRFIAMTHYDGETLRERLARTGPFRVEDAVQSARTIAEALHQVHRAGIVHRDVKPANIMMTAQGTLKLIDFGLATAAAETRRSASEGRRGTPAYMSPERADGTGTGPASDLWALGVLLFELLTGERPFSGERPLDVLDAIRREEAPSLRARRTSVSRALASIVDRCLRRDPADRVSSAAALADALASLEEGADAEAPSAIAVLPFASRDSTGTGPFTNGMHDSLLSHLSSVSDLKVVAGPAVDGDDRPRSALADELGVRWVVTGRVRRADAHIQIAVRLTDVRADTTAWAETYRRDLTAENLFDVQEQITRKITEALTAEVTPGERERITDTPTQNLDAYRLYVKGRAALNSYVQERVVDAVRYFRRAIQNDATYALAWAGLADAVNLFPLFGPLEAPRPDVDAEQAARRALELAPDLAEAHASLGYCQALPDGIPRLRHAVDLKPSYAQAHQWLGLKLLVAGKRAAAREHASIAADLAPKNRAAQGFLAYVMIAEGQYEEGLAILGRESRSFEVEPNWAVNVTSRFLFAALYAVGQWEKAEGLARQRRDAAARPRWRAEWTAKQGLLEVARGAEQRARRRAERLPERPGGLYRGLLHLALGDEDAACAAFRAVDTWGYYNVVELRYFYPELMGDFRETPRYEQLLDRVEQRRARNPTAAHRARSAPSSAAS